MRNCLRGASSRRGEFGRKTPLRDCEMLTAFSSRGARDLRASAVVYFDFVAGDDGNAFGPVGSALRSLRSLYTVAGLRRAPQYSHPAAAVSEHPIRVGCRNALREEMSSLRDGHPRGERFGDVVSPPQRKTSGGADSALAKRRPVCCHSPAASDPECTA